MGGDPIPGRRSEPHREPRVVSTAVPFPRSVGKSGVHLDLRHLPDLGFPSVPPRGLLLSASSLLVAGWVSVAWPVSLEAYGGFVWTLGLVPLFLLSYYRGWVGAALATAAVMATLTLAEVVVVRLLGRTVDWTVCGTASLLLVLVAVGAGWLSERLHRERIRAVRMAYEDPLTGLPSRRALDFYLGMQVAAARRGRSLSVVLFDLDEFKEYNDRHGHAAGDDFLCRVGGVLAEDTRAENLSGRYGGEEFLTVLPGEDARGARAFAERVRQRVAELTDDGAREGDAPTISAGVATFRDGGDGEQLLLRADAALYRAKEAGGNRVMVDR